MADKGKKFVPEVGKRYLNHNGFYYNCVGIDTDGNAVMQSDNKSRWTFSAVGCRKYSDGTIDWQYSLYGHFA